MSPPAENALVPAPVMTMQPTSSSALARMTASCSSALSCWLIALSCSGRFMVRIATPSDFSTRTHSPVISSSWPGAAMLLPLVNGVSRRLEIADLGHHVTADALEGPQHELVVADDVAHHHVVEAHVPVLTQIPDDGVRASHEELVETCAAIPFGKDGADDGARLLVGFADIDVAAQDRSRRAAGARRRFSV